MIFPLNVFISLSQLWFSMFSFGCFRWHLFISLFKFCCFCLDGFILMFFYHFNDFYLIVSIWMSLLRFFNLFKTWTSPGWSYHQSCQIKLTTKNTKIKKIRQLLKIVLDVVESYLVIDYLWKNVGTTTVLKCFNRFEFPTKNLLGTLIYLPWQVLYIL